MNHLRDKPASDFCSSLLEAVTKPRHREHKRMLEWYGGPFDPDELDRETIEAGMAKLARRRTIGQAAFAKSRSQL
ncbi:plasmid pRiA4b ORF-3 family protein [Methylobacterium sp. WL103]|uniref:plasmid pRiA4b ORF-3 family protein n=1 Tax=Methylobacterium sp. WL103 TaxID=2603891 RepID=UPI0011C78244|nr:plasmid pRiA4b ORF-3 family protein [Methylobacterium sp. WL103]TXN07680.1 plasmid pRiA4b ORF-3 family protein [Methylobacterium sp. WL103]